MFYRAVLSDPLGSGSVLLDEWGERMRHVVYRPFGGIHEEITPTAVTSALDRRYYAGHARQEESGLVYMQARWFDPDSGRFLSVDPVIRSLASPQSLNAYSYAENNPLLYNDPSGMNILAPPPPVDPPLTFDEFDGVEEIRSNKGIGSTDSGSSSGAGVQVGVGSASPMTSPPPVAGGTEGESQSDGARELFEEFGGRKLLDVFHVADVKIKGSPKVAGKDVIDIAKKASDKVAEKSGSPKARSVANTIGAIDRARNLTVIETDKIEAQVTVMGNLDPIDSRKSKVGIEIEINF